MAEKTGILWTDSTFNPWWGCSKVAPGCDNCYAHDLDKRTGGNHWGADKTPRITSDRNWAQPLKWQRQAEKDGRQHKVFCGSMCDWTDKNAPAALRDRLWGIIRQTPNLSWQLLTKRAPRINDCLPEDWGNGYNNVWLGVTVEDKKHGFPRIDHLRAIPAKVRFLSIEPLLEDLGELDLTGIDWVIIGGESGHSARPMQPAWVNNIICQCRREDLPVFFKQWGGKRDKGGCLVEGLELKEWPALKEAKDG